MKYHIDKFQRDNEGRIISVDIQSDVGSLRLISVYCPNDIPERKTFLSEIDRFLIGSKTLIIGGD